MGDMYHTYAFLSIRLAIVWYTSSMTGKTHAAIGANVVWLLTLTTLSINPLLIAVGALAALLPDLDASESTIKHLKVNVGRIRIEPFYLPALLFSALFKHRGWLHSATAIIIVAFLSWLGFSRYDIAVPLVITLGYASHLVADACTISGIQFFLPIQSELHLLPKPLRIRTGSVIDSVLFAVASLGVVYFVQTHGASIGY